MAFPSLYGWDSCFVITGGLCVSGHHRVRARSKMSLLIDIIGASSNVLRAEAEGIDHSIRSNIYIHP